MKLLDTSVIIGLLRGDQEIEQLVENEEETFCTCFPVQCELYRGTRIPRRTEEGHREVNLLLDELEQIKSGRESAKKVAELREKYPEINSFDLMIAGTCLANNVEIITKDNDFEKITELKVQKI